MHKFIYTILITFVFSASCKKLPIKGKRQSNIMEDNERSKKIDSNIKDDHNIKNESIKNDVDENIEDCHMQGMTYNSKTEKCEPAHIRGGQIPKPAPTPTPKPEPTPTPAPTPAPIWPHR